MVVEAYMWRVNRRRTARREAGVYRRRLAREEMLRGMRCRRGRQRNDEP